VGCRIPVLNSIASHAGRLFTVAIGAFRSS